MRRSRPARADDRAGLRPSALPYRAAYFLWRRTPERVRGRVAENARLDAAKTVVRDALASVTSREDIYNRDYYRYVDEKARESAPAIAGMILEEFAPASAVDVGCGTGAMLAELRARGLRVVGLEYSRHAIEV